MNLNLPYLSESLKTNNRIVMAPLTRNRSGNMRVPNEMNKIYYTQRSSAGLIISEATVISKRAVGYIDTPGIYNQDQIKAWKGITRSVHRYGGKIFCQLWHCGRISHPDFHDGQKPLSASAIIAPGNNITYQGKKERVAPKEMTLDEIKSTIQDYIQAAKNAMEAGFDGVEIHGANGYLVDQFLCDGSNHRTDEYGGSLENRQRFALEIINGIGEAIGFNKTAIRLTPSGTFNSMRDSNPKETFGTLAAKLDKLDLAYLHIGRMYKPESEGFPNENYLSNDEIVPFFRKIFNGTLMASTGYDKESAEKEIKSRNADLIAFGKLFISNPDLPKRFENDLELNDWDSSTFYGGDEKGYIDYPFV
jgi:N-ethylmaleimide reductase